MRSGNMRVGYAGACSGREVGAISFALSCPNFAILRRAQPGGHSSEMLDGLEIVYICMCVAVSESYINRPHACGRFLSSRHLSVFEMNFAKRFREGGTECLSRNEEIGRRLCPLLYIPFFFSSN
jgi:hypothetical protein